MQRRKTKKKSRSPLKLTLFSVHSTFLKPLTAAGLAVRTMICWTSEGKEIKLNFGAHKGLGSQFQRFMPALDSR